MQFSTSQCENWIFPAFLTADFVPIQPPGAVRCRPEVRADFFARATHTKRKKKKNWKNRRSPVGAPFSVFGGAGSLEVPRFHFKFTSTSGTL